MSGLEKSEKYATGFSKHKYFNIESKSYIDSVLDIILAENYYKNISKVVFIAPASGSKDLVTYLSLKLKWTYKIFRKKGFKMNLVFSNPLVKTLNSGITSLVEQVLVLKEVGGNSTIFDDVFKGKLDTIAFETNTDEKRPLAFLDNPRMFHETVIRFIESK